MSAKLGMTCDCVQQLNELLAARNLEVRLTFLFGGGPTAPQFYAVPAIPLDAIEKRPRQKKSAETITPKFCPFCGASINLPQQEVTP